MKNDSRGVIPVIYLVAAGAIALFARMPSWHLPAFLQPKPPTAQLSIAQDELAKAKAAQLAAEATLAAAKVIEAERNAEQLRYAQQMNEGARTALAAVPASAQGPETKLAAEFVGRTHAGLAAALGDLPAAQAAEIQRIFTEQVSSVAAERDAARASLAQKDGELQTATLARSSLEKQIPVLEATVKTKAAETAAKDAEVLVATHQVSAFADKTAAAEAKAGSLDAYAGNLLRILMMVAIGYALIHFALPSLAQEFPASKMLGGFYRTVASLTSSHALEKPSPDS